tara:strand:- start:373 stop:504 length:132 start_codon:yes stop_codon:yes gene_type:complete
MNRLAIAEMFLLISLFTSSTIWAQGDASGVVRNRQVSLLNALG